MDYQKQIQRVIDYIENNLTAEMDNAALAQIAGYSEYHFLRLFRRLVGVTPVDYVRKRRIAEIVREMIDGSEKPMSELAFAYGFNSKENFTRAFKKEHGILPTEFKQTQNSLRLYEAVQLTRSAIALKAKVVKQEPFQIVAYQCDEEIPSNFWNKYNTKKWSLRLSGGEVVEDFGVSYRNPKENRLDYYIGIVKEAAKGDLEGTVKLNIAGGMYAVFETPEATQFDFVCTIHKTWDYIIDVWLPEHGYERTGGYELESYIETSRSFQEKIYIPIRKKENKEELANGT